MSRSCFRMRRAGLARGALAVTVLFVLLGCQSQVAAPGWAATLRDELPRLGHRNFVVIADAAYPLQVNPGIRTVSTSGEHVDVLDAVLAQIAASPHVRPVIWLDAELAQVDEQRAPGVGALRGAFDERFAALPVQVAPHEDIIHRLDETAELFDVLLLKTDATIPYTSVFIELQCGYWGDDDEAALRAAIAGAGER